MMGCWVSTNVCDVHLNQIKNRHASLGWQQAPHTLQQYVSPSCSLCSRQIEWIASFFVVVTEVVHLHDLVGEKLRSGVGEPARYDKQEAT